MGQDTFDRLQLLDAKIALEEEHLSIAERIMDVFVSVPDDDMYDTMLSRVVLPTLKSKSGVFGYIDEHGDLICPSMMGAAWDQCTMKDKGFIFSPDSWGGLWGKSLREKKTLWANSGLKVPEGHFPLQRAMNGPIVFRGQLLGQLLVANKDSDYTRGDADILERICRVIAPVLYMRLQQDRIDKELADIKRQIAKGNNDDA